ncbi:MAG: methionyl-tRNA formyltransferase [Chloroflexi bacterium]|nr:methionyl-tRNA formyltransferase [Chloroflexota bacterium]
MRIVFMGTPQWAVPVLAALLAADHEVARVYTRPDSPSGRGQRLTPPPVKRAALARGITVLQPESLRRRSAVEELRAVAPEVIVVAAYGRILPPEALAIPPKGVLNVHPSLLPKYRGPSPVATAILDGVATTGVTIMLLDADMDTGPILAQGETVVQPDETVGALTERLFRLGADLLVETLPAWAEGRLTPRPQDNAQATVTKLVEKEDGQLDFTQPAARLAWMLRAYDPWPGCFTHWEGKVLKVLRGTVAEAPAPAGAAAGQVVRVLEGGHEAVCVVTGDGLLSLHDVQLEGKRSQPVAEFLRGYPRFAGASLPS